MLKANTTRQVRCRAVAIGGALIALALIAAPQEVAAQACGGAIANQIQFPAGTPNSGPFAIGDTVTIRSRFTNINDEDFDVEEFRHKLDCDGAPADFGSCISEDTVVSFDSFLDTDCVDSGGTPVVWGTAPDGVDPNIIVFTPGNPARLEPLGQVGASCDVRFDVTIESFSQDASPLSVAWRNRSDGECVDSQEPGAGEGSGSFPLEGTCDFVVDKRVACAGGGAIDVSGVDDGDPPDSTQSCEGWNAFDSTLAEAIDTTYFVKNTGPFDLVNCSLTDDNSALGIDQAVDDILVDGLAFGPIESSTNPVGFSGVCSETLDDEEPNTATLTCDCVIPGTEEVVESGVARMDTAAFECLTPGVSVTKDCAEQDAGDNAISITVANNGTADLINCAVVDTLDPGGSDTDIALTCEGGAVNPASFDLPAMGPAIDCTGTASGLTVDTDNEVEVLCEIAGSGGKFIGNTDNDVCEVPEEGCLTLTPGFWGTHPHITTLFVPLTVCGVDLLTTLDTAEAMCVSGGEGKKAGRSPQYVSLVRALTAAKLNIAASELGEGSCGEFEFDSETPNINDVIADCEALCGEDGNVLSECIDLLTAFNESEDTLDPFGEFESPGPADPSECKDAKNNGIIIQ